MSELLVQSVQIQAIKPHPNADRLEIATVGGWDIVTGIGNYKVGDIVVHVPPDAMVPKEWADRWDVTQYLSFKKNDLEGRGRVRAARLRGVVSYGFLVPNESDAELDTNLAEHYGIEKYEPPTNPGAPAGQMRREHPLFHRYTDIQNLRNYPDKIDWETTLVAVTEKIHGTNSRVGWVREDDGTYQLVVGTHRTQRDPKDCGIYGLPLEKYEDAFASLMSWALIEVEKPINSVIVFGEIYGAGVQDLHYGQKTEKDWRAFDIAINGEYMGYMAFKDLCEIHGIPRVPEIHVGICNLEDVLEMAEGNTNLDDSHIREGVVVRPAVFDDVWKKGEKDPNPKRAIFKAISGSYLTRKGGTEHH